MRLLLWPREKAQEKNVWQSRKKKKRPRKSEGENDGTMDETMVKEGDGEERSGSCDVGLCRGILSCVFLSRTRVGLLVGVWCVGGESQKP